MKSVTAKGKNIEEAVEAALEEIGLPRERVEVEVLEEPSKALFGLIGGKDAVVRVSACEDKEEFARRLLEEIVDAMGIEIEVTGESRGEALFFEMCGRDAALLIGRRGQTLNALQYLVNVAADKKCQERTRIVLDVEGYRKRRERNLVRLAQRMAEKATSTGRRVVLEPMNSHERKVVHVALQSNVRVSTASEGDEPYRRVVISPE